MRGRPNGADLLAIAHEVLVEQILPHIPSEQRYEALMVANAIANATREMQAGDATLKAELARLREIYGDAVEPPDAERLLDVLLRFNQRLARDVRAGRLDDRAELVQHHLIETAKAKVQETNPKYLEGIRQDGAMQTGEAEKLA